MEVLEDLPKSLPGLSCIEILVISDGSTDQTVEVAKNFGVHHLIDLKVHRGLSYAFKRGIEEGLRRGADLIVNTDGDHQYRGEDIAKLIDPILRGTADLVVGCRNIREHSEFSLPKKILQLVGSSIVRSLSQTTIQDVTSGFRAYSREATLRLTVTDSYTYTLETIIQAGNTPEIQVDWVEISCNPTRRESRLISTIPSYIKKSSGTLIRAFSYYSPFRFFLILSLIFYLPAMALGIRFLLNVYIFHVQGRTYIPSLILVSILLILGTLALLMGYFSLAHGVERQMILEGLYLKRKMLYEKKISE